MKATKRDRSIPANIQSERKIGLLTLLKEFLPLSLSDATMACGDPLITATLAHLPNSVDALAAVGVAKSISVFFESPVINILHASNALASNPNSRRALWIFTLLLGGSLSLLLGVLGLPWIFSFLARDILDLSPQLAGMSQQVVLLMFLWPFTIAWRRYFQGLLIFSGSAKKVAYASFVRLAALFVILWIGFNNRIPGNLLAGTALIVAVIIETALVTFFFRKRSQYQKADANFQLDQRSLPMTIQGVSRFYAPLANSMLVVWGGRFLLLAIIARSIDSQLALAAWPAAWGIVLVVANSTRMVQQIVIKYRHRVSDRLLLGFSLAVGGAFSFLLFLLAGSPLSHLLLGAFIGNNESLITAIRPVLLVGVAVPMLVSTQNATQGFLVSDGRTGSVNFSAWLGTTILLVLAVIGVWAGLPGALAAVIAMTISIFCEIVSLLWLRSSV